MEIVYLIFMTRRDLQDFTKGNRRLGLKTALAGSLKFENIPTLKRSESRCYWGERHGVWRRSKQQI
jgi:uncharacterized protein (UPF0264 family)